MGSSWATVTHARLRAVQGDPAGARELLLERLRGAPDDREALDLLALIDGAPARRHSEPRAVPDEPRRQGGAGELAAMRDALVAGGRPLARPPRRRRRRLRDLLRQL